MFNLDTVKILSGSVQISAKEVELLVTDLMEGKPVTDEELSQAYAQLTADMEALNKAIKLI